MLSDQQLLRYSRHIMLPQVDVAGQERICAATVLVVGLGGLGSPVAMYLAASGVGTLLLADFDSVDESNLQRQIVHRETGVGLNKAHSAAAALAELNSGVQVEVIDERLDEAGAEALFSRIDVCVDCSDNFATRFLLNRLAVRYRKPLVSGAAIRMEAQLSVFDVRRPESPCYRCIYEETGQEDRRCSTNGVLAPVVGVIGSLQAVESLKLLAGISGVMVGRMLMWDAANGDFRSVRVKRDPHCPVCFGASADV